jgi:hypothetical protein
MSKLPSVTTHEPTVETIELLCDRLADLGLAIGPDVARDLVQTILAAEAPRLDARLRETLSTSLDTIRTAAQSAIGALTAAAAEPPSPLAPTKAPASPPAPKVAAPAAPVSPPVESRRPIARRGAGQESRDAFPPPPPDDFSDEGARPVFKRPRGR